MNEQIESQTILFSKMMKNNKRRTVAHSFAYSCAFAGIFLWFQVQYAEKN